MNNELIKKYAEFAVLVGTNPKPEQTLIITCPVDLAYFARMCAEVAYEKANVKEVVVSYKDEQFDRIKYIHTDVKVLEDVKSHLSRQFLDYLESEGSACFLHILASDPEVFKGLDSEKVDKAVIAREKTLKPIRAYTMTDKVQWSIVALPTEAWATKVFPNTESEEAVERLWSAIFDVCRVTNGDPVNEWKEHIAKITSSRDRINELDLNSVHMTNAMGTDLIVGLADDAIWEGAVSKSEKGYEFIANIPTEEVFTAPHRDKTQGIVYATKPYVYNGNLIEDFWVRFEKGKVVEYGANRGEELLKQLLDTDEGARHIGEVALVPNSSPINQLGILFFETLFDENAACHIAFGEGYPTTIKNGSKMSKEELAKRGLNDSLVHEDIMVGSSDMKITGCTKSGEEVLIFDNGEWVI
jgi:aminopeptidase